MIACLLVILAFCPCWTHLYHPHRLILHVSFHSPEKYLRICQLPCTLPYILYVHVCVTCSFLPRITFSYSRCSSSDKTDKITFYHNLLLTFRMHSNVICINRCIYNNKKQGKKKYIFHVGQNKFQRRKQSARLHRCI